jgi:hypothetical protein
VTILDEVYRSSGVLSSSGAHSSKWVCLGSDNRTHPDPSLRNNGLYFLVLCPQ